MFKIYNICNNDQGWKIGDKPSEKFKGFWSNLQETMEDKTVRARKSFLSFTRLASLELDKVNNNIEEIKDNLKIVSNNGNPLIDYTDSDIKDCFILLNYKTDNIITNIVTDIGIEIFMYRLDINRKQIIMVAKVNNYNSFSRQPSIKIFSKNGNENYLTKFNAENFEIKSTYTDYNVVKKIQLPLITEGRKNVLFIQDNEDKNNFRINNVEFDKIINVEETNDFSIDNNVDIFLASTLRPLKTSQIIKRNFSKRSNRIFIHNGLSFVQFR